MELYDYRVALDKLTQIAKKEGYKTFFNYDNTSYISWKPETLNSPYEIRIEKGLGVESKVYILLHEMGHHFLRKDWKKFEKEFPIVAHADYVHFTKKTSHLNRSVKYKVSSLEEEYKAWEQGYRLGIKLGIEIDTNKWERFKSKCLMDYMQYYVNKK